MTEFSAGSSTLGLLTTRERLGIDLVKQSFLEWLVLEDRERQANYRMYRDYYDGIHEVMLTDRQKAFLELKDEQDFSANYCPLVVDELARRMTVDSFDADGELGGQKGRLWFWWRRGRMDSGQDSAHLSALRDGDTYVIVSWNQEEGRPEYHHNLAFDGTEGVKVHYSDETGKVIYASKRWVARTVEEGVGEVRRMNLYYPDRVERWISNDKVANGEWGLYTGDGQEGILSWVNKLGKPLGVPVFHLKYKATGFRWGRSILDNVITQQNALNKAIVDVIAAADATGFRLYWATGTDMIDDNGDPIEIHPGTFLSSDSPEASFGYMPGEDLRPLIEVVDMVKVTIAQISETPMHLFQVSGQNASEGAQKQQEVGMINKAEHWGISVGNFWEDCMYMSIKLSNTFDGTTYPEDGIISTVWQDMEVRDKAARRKQIADTAKVWSDAGASLEEAAKIAGVDEETAKLLGRMVIPVLSGALVPGTLRKDENSGEE